jgi:hypothetical protein
MCWQCVYCGTNGLLWADEGEIRDSHDMCCNDCGKMNRVYLRVIDIEGVQDEYDDDGGFNE